MTGVIFWLNGDQTLSRQLSFVYDIENRLTSASDPAALYNFTYDALGRATQIVASVTGMSDSVLLGQQFDALGNRTQLNVDIGSAVDSTTSYLYDARNRMTEILQNQAGATAASAALADKRFQLGYRSSHLVPSIKLRFPLVATLISATAVSKATKLAKWCSPG